MNNFIKTYSEISMSKKICKHSECSFFNDPDILSWQMHSAVTCGSKGIDIDGYVHKMNEVHNGKKIVDAISINSDNLFYLIEFKHLFSGMIDCKKKNKNSKLEKCYSQFDFDKTRDECILEILNKKFEDTLYYIKSKNIDFKEKELLFVYKIKDISDEITSINHLRMLVSNLRKKIISLQLHSFRIVDYENFEKSCHKYNLDLEN